MTTLREHLLRILDHSGDILDHVDGLEVTRLHIHTETLAALELLDNAMKQGGKESRYTLVPDPEMPA